MTLKLVDFPSFFDGIRNFKSLYAFETKEIKNLFRIDSDSFDEVILLHFLKQQPEKDEYLYLGRKKSIENFLENYLSWLHAFQFYNHFLSNLMEQNNHILCQMPSYRSISCDDLIEYSEKFAETKNQISPVREFPKKVPREFNSIEILSRQIFSSYELNPNLISHTQISELNRAKIRLWFVENCHTRKLSYRTASLACYILDLYFLKGNKCSLEEFQEFGICCLRIANKLEDNYFIPVNYEVFNKEKLTDIETQICMKIGFQLNPITFTEISHSLNYLWSQFRANRHFELLKCTPLDERIRIVESEHAFVLLHQLLELSYLVLKSFSFKLDSLVSNAFYLIFCLQFEDYQRLLSSAQIQKFAQQSHSTCKIWTAFVNFCSGYSHQMRLQIDPTCLSFLFPIYNSLISESQHCRPLKGKDLTFNPNDQKFRLMSDRFEQTLHFKNKKNSLRKYMKRDFGQKLRKCSESTHL